MNGTLNVGVNATLPNNASLEFRAAGVLAPGAADAFDVAVNVSGSVVRCAVHVIAAHLHVVVATISLSARDFVHFSMGGLDDGGGVLNASVVRLPTLGVVSRPAFRKNFVHSYASMVPGGDAVGVGLLNLGPASVLSFTPSSMLGGNDTFIASVTSAAGVSATFTVEFEVARANMAPIAHPQRVVSVVDAPLLVTLTGEDPDGIRPSFLVTRGLEDASLGGIYQVLPSGTLGAAIRPDPPSIVDQYASGVLNVSSQYSQCGCVHPPCADTACAEGDFSGWQVSC